MADTPLVGFDVLLGWMDSLGIPRTWPLGPPQWQGNSRDSDIWNAQGGHYGHCNVPDNTHTDPGPMPDITKFTISTQGATIKPVAEEEDDMFDQKAHDQLAMALDDAHRARGVLDSIEVLLHSKLLDVSRWVKGKNSDTIYEIRDGKLRPISALEWKVLGRPAPDVRDQADIDAMPKVV